MQIRRAGDKAICEFRGRLLYEHLSDVNLQLEELLGDGVRQLYVKIDQLLYLDSSALGMILSLNAKFNEGGGRLSIVSPPRNIEAMFRATRLDEVLEILNDEDALLATAELME